MTAHHFVPEFLLKPWVIEEPNRQLNLWGYWYCPHQQRLMCKHKGLNSFCFQLDLLTLSAHKLGRDVIERIFFGTIDAKGAIARDILLAKGTKALTEEQRCDFARLLLSLDARRPQTVDQLRTQGTGHLSTELDKDPKIRAAMTEHGFGEDPSQYVENVLGWSLEDHALSIIQGLVDNPKVGGRLINANWDLKVIGPHDGSLVLSDRPLIRINGYDSPGGTWVLPLTPTTAFIAANHETNLTSIKKTTGQRFVKLANISSVSQAERFVFSIQKDHEIWLEKRLRQRTLSTSGSRTESSTL